MATFFLPALATGEVPGFTFSSPAASLKPNALATFFLPALATGEVPGFTFSSPAASLKPNALATFFLPALATGEVPGFTLSSPAASLKPNALATFFFLPNVFLLSESDCFIPPLDRPTFLISSILREGRRPLNPAATAMGSSSNSISSTASSSSKSSTNASKEATSLNPSALATLFLFSLDSLDMPDFLSLPFRLLPPRSRLRLYPKVLANLNFWSLVNLTCFFPFFSK